MTLRRSATLRPHLDERHSIFTNPKLIPALSPRDKLRLALFLEKGRKNAQASEFPNLSPRFGPWALLVFCVKHDLAILRAD
jgi:hypothetical protein